MLGHLHAYFNQMQLSRQKIVLNARQTTRPDFQKVLEREMAGWWHVRSRMNWRNTLASQRTQHACSSSAATWTSASGAIQQTFGEALKLAADTVILHNLLQILLSSTATNSIRNALSLPVHPQSRVRFFLGFSYFVFKAPNCTHPP